MPARARTVTSAATMAATLRIYSSCGTKTGVRRLRESQPSNTTLSTKFRWYVRILAPARRHDRRAAVPRRAGVGQRGDAAHGPAGRAARAARVLGLLPAQLAADAALREGVARALRARRAAGHRRPHAGVRALARQRRRA